MAGGEAQDGVYRVGHLITEFCVERGPLKSGKTNERN